MPGLRQLDHRTAVTGGHRQRSPTGTFLVSRLVQHSHWKGNADGLIDCSPVIPTGHGKEEWWVGRAINAYIVNDNVLSLSYEIR